MKNLFMKILIVESAYLVVWSASASDYVPWFTELVSMSEILLFPDSFVYCVSVMMSALRCILVYSLSWI